MSVSEMLAFNLLNTFLSVHTVRRQKSFILHPQPHDPWLYFKIPAVPAHLVHALNSDGNLFNYAKKPIPLVSKRIENSTYSKDDRYPSSGVVAGVK